MSGKINHGKVAMSWWSKELAAETTAASSLRARLRRAKQPSIVLSERSVYELAQRLELRNPLQIHRLAKTLGRITHHDNKPLLALLGGSSPKLSPKRFNRLLTMELDDVAHGVGNAIDLASGRCNVAQISRDVLFWGEPVRCRWCFDYHNVPAPAALQTTTDEEFPL
jgi:CRISPR type I-E-associated protein CasB/Cse2